MKTVGIVGLGLIGGSMARAYKLYSDSDCQVLGMDRDKATLDVAMLTGAVDRPLTADNIGTCELLLIALFLFCLFLALAMRSLEKLIEKGRIRRFQYRGLRQGLINGFISPGMWLLLILFLVRVLYQ